MKLPLLKEVYSDGILVDELVTEFVVGEQRSNRTRCPKCLNMFSFRTEYKDCNNGYGAWVLIGNPHCL